MVSEVSFSPRSQGSSVLLRQWEFEEEQRGSLHGSCEAERKRREKPGQDIPFKDTSSITCFLQPGPISSQPIQYELINGLTH
jgi:hypothetical protein